MPSSEAILNSATSIANEWRVLSLAWHVGLAVLMAGLFTRWRPSNRLIGFLLAAPFVTVSSLAWTEHNPFNGTVFVILALFLAAVATRLPDSPVQLASPIAVVGGAAVIAFGAAYPHFLVADSWILYVLMGPFGVLPCPTLAVVIGVTMLCGTLRSTPWSAALIVAGCVYGLIGIFKLNVRLDYGLLAGTVMLVATLKRR